jgi:two-component system, chemotaxis family, response regulator Rcp1
MIFTPIFPFPTKQTQEALLPDERVSQGRNSICMRSFPNEPVRLLLVEDSGADIRLFQEILKTLTLQTYLDIVKDGEEALAFLQQQAPYAHAQRPNFIFLDMYLPKKSGFEVLVELEQDATLNTIPVVACIGSVLAKEQLEPYQLPADCFFMKGYDPEQLLRILTHCRARPATAV